MRELLRSVMMWMYGGSQDELDRSVREQHDRVNERASSRGESMRRFTETKEARLLRSVSTHPDEHTPNRGGGEGDG